MKKILYDTIKDDEKTSQHLFCFSKELINTTNNQFLKSVFSVLKVFQMKHMKSFYD